MNRFTLITVVFSSPHSLQSTSSSTSNNCNAQNMLGLALLMSHVHCPVCRLLIFYFSLFHLLAAAADMLSFCFWCFFSELDKSQKYSMFSSSNFPMGPCAVSEQLCKLDGRHTQSLTRLITFRDSTSWKSKIQFMKIQISNSSHRDCCSWQSNGA